MGDESYGQAPSVEVVTLALAGDVMTGRGVDQVLPHPGDPRLHETYVRSALRYVALAEEANGPIPRPVDFRYVWGDALGALDRAGAELRIVNLETAVTRSSAHWPGKGIHYRMHPANAPCLTSAGLDCCVLANNHVLDWGHAGLEETLRALQSAGIRTAGAGRNAREASTPVVLEAPRGGRVLVIAAGVSSSGIPRAWAASARPGVRLLPDLSPAAARRFADSLHAVRRAGDVVVASLHWGGNWGYAVPEEHRRFAHQLIDEAGVDVVHGHSSHHPLGLEVYRNRLILYGCGDLLNDYEGIGGYAQFRTDLVALYVPRVAARGAGLQGLTIIPLQLRRMRLGHPSEADVLWLAATLDRESRPFGVRVVPAENGTLAVRF